VVVVICFQGEIDGRFEFIMVNGDFQMTSKWYKLNNIHINSLNGLNNRSQHVPIVVLIF
jgi:hypothetical protein